MHLLAFSVMYPKENAQIIHTIYFLYCFILIWNSGFQVFGQKSCVYLELGNNDPVMTVLENTTVTIPFTLNTESCNNVTKIILRVLQNDSVEHDECLFTAKNKYAILNDSCTSFGNGSFQFKKPVNRTNNGLWTWSTIDGEADSKTILMNVKYPAKVTGVAINDKEGPGPHMVDRNQNVTVSCSMENGNPPSSLYVLHSYGNSLTTRNTSNDNITYRLLNASCNDAGVIVCKTDSSDQNKTVTLLVKCPPIFTEAIQAHYLNAIVSHDVSTKLSFRAHTANITLCQLSKIHGVNTTYTRVNAQQDMSSERNVTLHCGIINCSNFPNRTKGCCCSVCGLAPDLNLEIVVFNVSKLHTGKWRLALSNQEGQGQFEVSLHLLPSKPASGNIQISVLIWGTLTCIPVIIIVTIAVLLKRVKQEKSAERDVLTTHSKNISRTALDMSKMVEYEEAVMVINDIYEKSGNITLQKNGLESSDSGSDVSARSF